jgi:hypothetical protein
MFLLLQWLWKVERQQRVHFPLRAYSSQSASWSTGYWLRIDCLLHSAVIQEYLGEQDQDGYKKNLDWENDRHFGDDGFLIPS